jgi:hypothetical protein
MFKLLNFVVILFFSTISCSFAQTIFDQPATKPGSTTMSPTDFQNAVNQRSKQTRTDLDKQVKDMYPKTPQPVIPGTNTTAGTQAPITMPQAAPTTTPKPTPDSFSINSGTTNKVPGSAPTAAPSKPSDTYTGFGTGNSGSGTNRNKSNTPASSGNSGGWNINY